jgi:Protein of unknown function (DUF4238)
MGHHYVPQKYLKGFEVPNEPGMIWTYDKQTRKKHKLPIKKVAQARNYYDNADEMELNYEVEIPAMNSANKLIQSRSLDDSDRDNLSYFLATTVRRVPNARLKFDDLYPQALAEALERTILFYRDLANSGKLSQETLSCMLAELEQYRIRHQSELPDEIQKMKNTPWPFASWLGAIHGMYWRVLVNHGKSRFLTSDNPAYFFEAYGFAGSEQGDSEIGLGGLGW